jgi:hypothetical protein
VVVAVAALVPLEGMAPEAYQATAALVFLLQ